MDRYELVTLCAGAGALDLAAHDLGLPAVGIEWDEGTCSTRRAAGLLTKEGDVRDFTPSDFPSANILAGGPPCLTFSVAGSKTGHSALKNIMSFMQRMTLREDVRQPLAEQDDVRMGLVLEPLRWALVAIDSGHPYEAVVLIQAPTVLPIWEAMGDVLRTEGYSVAVGILRAEEFGVPQTRRRAVLIARRHGVATLPPATHQPYGMNVRTRNDSSLALYIRMGEVLDRPEPFNLISNYGTRGDPKSRGRRTSDEPAFTITGKFSRSRITAVDGTDLRRLSYAEAGQLQSFPADYPWAGRNQAQQIGNATPALLATHILTAALR